MAIIHMDNFGKEVEVLDSDSHNYAEAHSHLLDNVDGYKPWY